MRRRRGGAQERSKRSPESGEDEGRFEGGEFIRGEMGLLSNTGRTDRLLRVEKSERLRR